MLVNAMNPYWWAARPLVVDNSLPRVDVGGIYKLSTNAVTVTDTTVDYGINPCTYNRLPNESLVLLKIHEDAPASGSTLPVTIVVPNNGSSTVTSSTSTSGTSKINVIDSQGNNVTGASVKAAERFVYINKCSGTIRFMEFTNATA